MEWINWDNEVRLHGEIGHVSPAEFEAEWRAGTGDQDGKPALTAGEPIFYSAGLSVIIPARYIAELMTSKGEKWTGATSSRPPQRAKQKGRRPRKRR